LDDHEWNVLVIDYTFHRPAGDEDKPQEDYWIDIASTAYWSGLSMSAGVAVRWHEDHPQDSDDEGGEEGEQGEDEAMEEDGSEEDDEEDVSIINDPAHDDSENDIIETEQAESDTDSATAVSDSASPH
jgi:hypothetical protein